MLWRVRLALAAPALLLVSGCDFVDQVMGVKKPLVVEGAKDLAGSWRCDSKGSIRGGANAVEHASLTLLRDGTATSLTTVAWDKDGQPAEMKRMQRLKWRSHGGLLKFETTYSVVTGYQLGGKRQDLGEANKVEVEWLDKNLKRDVAMRIGTLTTTKLAYSQPSGALTECSRGA